MAVPYKPHVKNRFFFPFLHRYLQKSLSKYTRVHSYTKMVELLNIESQLCSELVATFFSIIPGNSELRVKQVFERYLPSS